MGILSNFIRSYSDEGKAPETQASIAAADSQPQLAPHTSTSGSTPQPRIQTAAQAQPQQGPITASISKSLEVDTDTLYQNPRARLIKQLSVYFAGATFLTLSILVTKRSVSRKLLATKPLFYHPSNTHAPAANGAVEAAEALALATVNVSSFALMMTGGAMFATDVVNTEDLRRKYKMKQGFLDGKDGSADEEIEEWVRNVLEKKDGGDYKGVAEGLTALVGVLAGKEEDREKLIKMNAEGKEAKAAAATPEAEEK